MKIEILNNELNIRLDKSLLDEKEILDIVNYLHIKEILHKSKLKEENVFELDEELKNNW